MPRYRYCVAPGCSSVIKPKSMLNYDGTMHKFPDARNKPELFQEWVRFCQRTPQWQPSSSSYICDDHFVRNKKTFSGTSVPTLPAKMVTQKCQNISEHLSNLPLDTTLELFEDQPVDIQSTSFPTQTGLPADRTLDNTAVDFDADLLVTEETNQSADFVLGKMKLVRIPSGWTLLLDDADAVMFAEIDKPNIRISRFVGFNSDLGKTFILF